MQNNDSPCKIFLINCLSAIQQPLVRHDVATNYMNRLGSMIEMHVNGLVESEVNAILSRCGLQSKMPLIEKSVNGETGEDIGALAEMHEMSPPLLSECLRSFFGIVTGTEGSLPEFELIQAPRLRSHARVLVARALADTYELLYQAVTDPKNQYPDPKSLARHTPDQVRTILEI